MDIHLEFSFDTIPRTIKKITETFEERVIEENRILQSGEEIRPLLNDFLNKNPNFAKIINISRLAAKQHKFTLQPLVAKFSADTAADGKSYSIGAHCGRTIAKRTKHPVFILPRANTPYVTYEYCMAIYIGENIIDDENRCNDRVLKQFLQKNEEKILTDTFDLVLDNIDTEFKEMIHRLTPMCTISRMYGYDGVWILLNTHVKDRKDVFWSPPVVDSEYRTTQPFLIAEDGEFLIFQRDSSIECCNKTERVMENIKERMKYIKALTLREEEEINVNDSWLIAHGITNGELNKISPPKHSSLLATFGEHISIPTLSGYDLSYKRVLELMKRESVGPPMHRFSNELIKKYGIINKK